ncbi:cholesterol 7-desaturase nvd-like [Ixodes scapularis]|uniref:cholesterol 7-desaturase nvd-like n=1 Tax=Ixodes scapularis TaxID=6945 RepID=UPI001A9E4F11|nr:cholesterol 7-desaturase nvd-like [Ixodes scapularis]
MFFLVISYLLKWCLPAFAFGTFLLYVASFISGRRRRSAELHRKLQPSRKRYPTRDLPPVFPNGWIPVLESSDLRLEEVKQIDLLGLELVAFRTKDGVAHVADAYCPHLGAHLGAVGRVVGDCIECPFHGWRFSGKTGACTHAPFSTKLPEFVRLKQWEVHELLGFVFIWHHAEGEAPSWRIEDCPEITGGDWKLYSRFDDRISCHIRDLIENAFDVAHAKHLHTANAFLSPVEFLQSGAESFWARFMMNHWTVKNRIEGHVCFSEIDADASILGKRRPFLHALVTNQAIGPALMLERVQCKFASALAVIAMLPEEPLQVRVIQRLHFEPNAPWLFRWILSNAQQSQPIDRGIVQFRKWFAQFFSENSPTWQAVQERTLQW